MEKHMVVSAISRIDSKSLQIPLETDIQNNVNLSYRLHPDLDDTQSAIAIVDYLQKENEVIVELLKRFTS